MAEESKKGFLHKIQEFIATGFFIGYIPFAPGTFGTLIGVAIYIFLSPVPVVYYPLILLLLVGAVPLSDYAEKHVFKVKDSPHIVIDEVVGFLITMISFHFTPDLSGIKYLVFGFGFFRLFDIWKPYPIKKSQKLEGGLGIVIDDVLAGVYANLFMQFIRLLDRYTGF